MQTERGNNETIRGRSERIKCLRRCFLSFRYVIDPANVLYFLLNKLFTLNRSQRVVCRNVNLSNLKNCFTKKSKNRQG